MKISLSLLMACAVALIFTMAGPSNAQGTGFFSRLRDSFNRLMGRPTRTIQQYPSEPPRFVPSSHHHVNERPPVVFQEPVFQTPPPERPAHQFHQRPSHHVQSHHPTVHQPSQHATGNQFHQPSVNPTGNDVHVATGHHGEQQQHTSKAPEDSCPGLQPNHLYENRNYLVTFAGSDIPAPCKNFTGEEAEAYCQSIGGHAVSLDSTVKAQHFHDVARQHAQRYFWTGGRIDHSIRTVTWPSGLAEGYEEGERFWSYTGGAEPPRAQPDNRDGNEFCIGVLNNFYADGIKWHDVACHHRKPTICEL